MIKTIFSLLVCFGIGLSVSGQKELVATFPIVSDYSYMIHHEIRNDSVAVYLGDWSSSYFFSIDLNNPSITSSPDRINNQGNMASAGSALFYTTFQYEATGNDGHYYINFQDFEGNRFVSVAFSDKLAQGNVTNYQPQFSGVLNNEYYVVGYHNSEYCIWKSNGTASGTSVVAHYPSPIQNLDVVDGSLIYYIKTPTQYIIYSLQSGGIPVIIDQIPIVNYPEIQNVSSLQSRAFFRFRSASNTYSIWSTDETNSSISLFRDDCDGGNVQTNDSLFFITIYNHTTGQYERYKGNLSDPSVIVLAPEGYDNVSVDSYFHAESELGSGYVSSDIANKGNELAYRTAGDSLHLIRDFIPGVGSGLISFLSVSEDSVAITLQTVGARPFLCMVDRDSITPLFYVDQGYSVKYAFMHDAYLYWYERKTADSMRLCRRLLTDLDAIELNPQDSLTWYKEIGTLIKNTFGNMYYTTVYNEGVFIDKDDAVLSAFTNAQSHSKYLLIENAAGGLDELIGRDVITKRDKFGKLQWVKSLGSDSDYYDHGIMTKTIHDDVLVLNDFSYKAYFENDSMTLSSGSVGNYLVKLSNEDGSIVWKKNLFPYSDNGHSVYCDGVVSDEKGNIYVSFLYFGFQAMIEDYEILSEVSPTNALAKLDSSGTILWVENIPTPWTNDYGNTTVLKWNEEKQTVLAVQTQAKYNTWSSCDFMDFQTFVQTIDTSGVVLDTFNYSAGDLSGVMTGEILPDNNYFLSGYYRGELNVGDYSTVSEPTNNCFKSEGYQLSYSPASGEPVSLIRSYETGFNPVGSVLNDGFVYVIGSDNGGRLKIARFTDKGVYSGYLPLNQIQYVSEFSSRHNYIDVKNGYIVIQSQSFVVDSVYDVYPYTTNIDPTSNVLKIENKGWIMDDYFDHQSIPTNTFLNWNSDLGVKVYPNPFNDVINLEFKTLEHGYDSYKLYDLNGRLITSGSINHTALEQSVMLNSVSNGAYMLHLMGSGSDDVFKLIHTNK